MRDEIAASFGHVLEQCCTPRVVRAIEAGGDHRSLWSTLEQTGFADALIPTQAGGAGLSLADAFPIPELCGHHAVPLAFAETMIWRGILGHLNVTIPSGSITFAGQTRRRGEEVVSGQVVCGMVADWAVLGMEGEWRLAPIAAAQRTALPFALDAMLIWPRSAIDRAVSVRSNIDERVIQAFVHSVQIAGALDAVFARTVDYANERKQFGRPIGKFQAIQHQLSVMAEHVFAARMAADIASSRDGMRFDRLKIAIAKARTSEAAVEVAALSHSVHGAIGFTEEYDLQLLTRRLNAWRLSAGSEGYWYSEVGEGLFNCAEEKSLDFLRRCSDLS
jgi:acyl-CoA dehydrogenase